MPAKKAPMKKDGGNSDAENQMLRLRGMHLDSYSKKYSAKQATKKKLNASQKKSAAVTRAKGLQRAAMNKKRGMRSGNG